MGKHALGCVALCRNTMRQLPQTAAVAAATHAARQRLPPPSQTGDGAGGRCGSGCVPAARRSRATAARAEVTGSASGGRGAPAVRASAQRGFGAQRCSISPRHLGRSSRLTAHQVPIVDFVDPLLEVGVRHRLQVGGAVAGRTCFGAAVKRGAQPSQEAASAGL